MIIQSLPWLSPLDAAEALAKKESCWALLHSGQQLGHTGRYSYLALCAQETVSGARFSLLRDRLSSGKTPFENAWFGYCGYELHTQDVRPCVAPAPISLPELWFTRFGLIFRFDHEKKEVTCWREPHLPVPAWPSSVATDERYAPPAVVSLTSPMSRQEYLRSIERTKEAIAAGDFYQANITRKFAGAFAQPPKPFAIFRRLCAASPAAYGAFLRIGDTAILSSSPERFLTIDAQGGMESRPIKGTAARRADKAADAAALKALQESSKDRAENLMIVDLMRNDIAQSAQAGSVRVERLFEVSSYANLHHMASTVVGRKRAEVSTLAAVQNAFPPGSMTGAPKIRAMQWCAHEERVRRGVYSGALGFFGGDGSCDLCVVIRTLLLRDACFEFQVGGGIVADSVPEEEWRETLTKARGIMNALGIEWSVLESL